MIKKNIFHNTKILKNNFKMKILISGACGHIGSFIINDLIKIKK